MSISIANNSQPVGTCPNCGDIVHEWASCDNYKRWKEENSQGDLKFLEYIKANNLVLCPWCGQAIERISGCKYMTCNSSNCRNLKFFCFDCKQGLSGDHSQHSCTTAG